MTEKPQCTAFVHDGAFQCGNRSVANGFCRVHHPDRIEARDRMNDPARIAFIGLHDFWCQIQICALMLFLEKVSPAGGAALRKVLCN